MMTKLIRVSATGLFFNLLFLSWAHSFEIQEYEKKIKNAFMVKNVVGKMPRSAIEKKLRDFVASARPNRLPGTPGHKKALEFLEAQLKDAQVQTFPVEGESGSNVVWEKLGKVNPDEVLILGANYDAFLKDIPGDKSKTPKEQRLAPAADNNGSGVALLLSMIEIFEKLDLPKTVKVVFFDREEKGALGSKAYVNKLFSTIGQQRIVGFINLTSLAHDTKVSDQDKKMKNMKIYLRAKGTKGSEGDFALGNGLVENGKKISGEVNFSLAEVDPEGKEGEFFETANSFWKMGIPAVIATQNREGDLNPRHFTSNDFVETLNMPTYTSVYNTLMSAILAWNYGVVK